MGENMKSIGIWIAKGGVGKSTTAGNLAHELKNQGRVLLLDADPQGNLSSWLHPEPFSLELADVLKGGSLESAVLNLRPGLDLLPTFGIGGGLKPWAETVLPGLPFAFHDLREKIQAAGYDYAVFDMSPGASILERAIIASLDEVLPIARPEYFAVDGLEIFQATLAEINKAMRAKATAPRLLVNGLNLSFSIHKDYHETLKALPYDLHTIPQTVKATEAQSAHLFLAEYDTENRALDGYRLAAKAIA
jgi:chromosome partitioning protein